MDLEAKQDTVTISGEVIFEDYKKGPIIVGAYSKRDVWPPDIALVEIPKPGKYAFKVPVNAGDIYLAAMNMQVGEAPGVGTIAGAYKRNPVKVGSSDIGGVDIRITKELAPLMKTYEGPTITISGEVIFEDYEKYPIGVFAYSEGYIGPPDVAFVKIRKPGKYTLEVPVNAGYINLIALNKRLRDRPGSDTPAGAYERNPLKVGSSNIEEVNIVISRK